MISLAFIIVGIGMFLTFIRVLLGKTFADRVVGIDSINIMIVTALGLYAAIQKNSFYLDIAIVYSILAFVETIVLSKFIEGRQA